VANNFTTNPIVVDTAFATAIILPVFVIALDEIYWFNPTTIGHTFSVTLSDQNKVLRTGRAEVANQSQVFDMHGMRISSLLVPTLTGGTLYIYWHPAKAAA
jgi:hypothetical protein